MTTTGLGGRARFLAEPRNEAELAATLSWATGGGVDVFVLGGGSNTVCADAGVDGLVVRYRAQSISESPTRPGLVTADAGAEWDQVVAWSVERGLSGIECLSGIPGSAGATPIQNVGAYGQEISEVLESVEAWDRHAQQSTVLSHADCEFAYRNSRFKGRDRGRYVVTRITLRLTPKGSPAIRYPELARRLEGESHPSPARIREHVLAARRAKSMVYEPSDPNHRSCGSFFLNPVISEMDYQRVSDRAKTPPPRYPAAAERVKVPAAWLIEQAGFRKGQRAGNVGLSSRHTLCLVCHDGATSGELVRFASQIQAQVLERFGIALTPEPEFWGLEAPTA